MDSKSFSESNCQTCQIISLAIEDWGNWKEVIRLKQIWRKEEEENAAQCITDDNRSTVPV